MLVYAAGADLDTHTEPVAVLRGVVYPHGLHFTSDGRSLVVADAGRPLVHVFAADGDEWRGAGYPIASHRVMDEPNVPPGEHDTQEGGPKGLDLDRTGHVVAVTSERQPLAFLDLATLLATPGSAGPQRRLDFEHTVLEREQVRRRILEDTAQRADVADPRATDAIRIAAAASAHGRGHARADAHEQTKLMRLIRPASHLSTTLRGRHAHHDPHPRRRGTHRVIDGH